MEQAAEATFSFSGGNVGLDFANTVNCYTCAERSDKLASYGDLVAWTKQAGLVDAREAGRLAREAARRPGEAAATLETAKRLREAMFRIVSAAAHGEAAGREDLGAFNAALATALGHTRLAFEGGAFEWGWDEERSDLERILWPVVRATAWLLVSDDLARVRECGGDECTWLFLDMSKNKSRRWCDMSECGNRAKSRRHYARARAAKGGEARAAKGGSLIRREE